MTVDTVQVETKWCPKCLAWLDIDDFYRNKASRDGRQAYCKICFNAFLKEPTRAAKRAELAKEYNQRQDVIVARRKRQKEYHKNDRVQKRHKAAMAVNAATRNGTLPHISHWDCQSCGEPAEHYHHWAGYSKKHWLHVLPICAVCHKEVDAYIRGESGGES